MAEILRTDLVGVTATEASERLLELNPGIQFQIHPQTTGLLFVGDTITTAMLDAAFNGWVPTSTGQDPTTYVPIPKGIREHAPHLREYLDKPNNTITTADTVHAVKDILRVMKFTERDLFEAL